MPAIANLFEDSPQTRREQPRISLRKMMANHCAEKHLTRTIFTIIFVLLAIALWRSSLRGPTLRSEPVHPTPGKRDAHQLEHTSPDSNRWFTTLKFIVRQQGNGSCYVCSLIPHASHSPTVLVPVPLTALETLAVFVVSTSRGNRTYMATKYPWVSNFTFSFDSWRDATSLSKAFDRSLIFEAPVYHFPRGRNGVAQPQVCIVQRNVTKLFLGQSTDCLYEIYAACGSDCTRQSDPYTYADINLPFPHVLAFNVTALGLPLSVSIKNTGSIPYVNIPTMEFGYSTPRSFVWVCGQRSYLFLPAGWSGTCYLARLIPNVFVYSNLSFLSTIPTHHRVVKRNRLSGGELFLSGILPWWGAVKVGHEINALGVCLENLTSFVEEGFNLLEKEAKYMRMMLLQHQIGLDFLLAERGGLCQVIGQNCCTFIPDISQNMSDIHSALDALREKLHAKNEGSPEQPWDFWSWLLVDGWKAALIKLVTAVVMVLCIFLCLSCCIIPLFRSMLSRMFTTHFLQYAQVPVSQENSDSVVEDEDDIFFDV